MLDREDLERLMVTVANAARDDTTADPVILAEEVLADLAEPEGPPPRAPFAAKLAEERLEEATMLLKEEGLTETAALLAASIGIGYALLAIRDDAEVFFAGGA